MPADPVISDPAPAATAGGFLRRRRLIVAVLVVVHLLGFVSSLDALMSTRTAPGTVAWMVSLNTIAYIAVPAYWVFGRSKFQGYVIGRREDESLLYRELDDQMSLVHPYRVVLAAGERQVHAIERLAKMPMVGANGVELLIDGEATFRCIFDGIAAARDYVLVQFYIVRDDTPFIGYGHGRLSPVMLRAHPGHIAE